MPRIEGDAIERDDRLGEAIEEYLGLAESGDPPEPEAFADRYPELSDDLIEALDGLAMVRGLVGDPGGAGRALQAGRRVAGYRIVRELGRGGMGVVYEAVHVDLDRPVALKVLGAQAAPDSTSRLRFLNEAKTAAGLHHTHIVPVFDVGQVGGLCYYAMQRIEGCGLDRVLKSLRRDRSRAAGSASDKGRTAPVASSADDLGGPSLLSATASWGGPGRVPADESQGPTFEPPKGSAYHRWAAELGRQAAEALAYAHRSGVIHRDVKPSNLLIDEDGEAWVADFGLARRLADPGLTRTDSLLGTPRYMSPEQAEGAPLDARTDVYSLGATLYELLTLAPPFDGRTAAELVHQIRHRDPAPPRRADRRIPRDLETIVLKAMSKRPGDRYTTAAELAEDLRRFLDLEPVRARRIGPVGRTWRLARRHPLPAAISAVSAAAIVAVTAWAFVNIDHERTEALLAKGAAEDAEEATKVALAETREAVLLSNRAHRESLWREAGTIRASARPDRRRLGLDRLREAAALEPPPAPEMAVRLRDEAIEFLALRDVEAGVELATGPTWGLAFLDDQTLATLDADGDHLTAWNLDTAAPRREVALRNGPADSGSRAPRLRPSRREDDPRPFAGLSGAGPLAAVVWPNGRGVRLLAARCGTPMADLEFPGRQVDGIDFGPDGHRLVTLERVEDDGRAFGLRVVLWDAGDDSRPLAVLAEPDEPDDRQVGRWRPRWPSVAFAPDGQTVAVAWIFAEPDDPEAGIRLFDANTGALLRTIPAPPAPLSALVLGPDNAVAGATIDGMVRLWDGANATPQPGVFPHHQNLTTSLRFSPDGSLLALAGIGAVIEIWDPATNTLAATLRTPDRPRDLAFSPDGRTLAASCGEVTATWRIVEAVGRQRLLNPDSWLQSLAFADGRLAIGSRTRTDPLKFWDPSRGPAAVRLIPEVHAASVASDGRGQLIASSEEGLIRIGPDGGQTLILAASKDLDSPPTGPNSPFAVGLAVAAGLPAPARREPERRSVDHSPVTSTPDGRLLAFSRGDAVILLDGRRGPAVALRVSSRHVDPAAIGRRGRGRGGPERFRDLALAPDGRTLILLSYKELAYVWDLDPDAPAIDALRAESNRALGHGTDHDPGPPRHGRPDPSVSVLFADERAVYRDVSAIALSPDGRTLALGGLDGLVRLIGTETGAPLGSTSDEGGGHIDSLAFAPDGRSLAVGHQEGQIALWGLHDLRPFTHLPGHRGSVVALTFDPTGARLASIGGDKVAQVWDLAKVRARLEALGLDW